MQSTDDDDRICRELIQHGRAAFFCARLYIVALMCNLEVSDAVVQANRMTDVDQETRRRSLRFPGCYFVRGNRCTPRASHERCAQSAKRGASTQSAILRRFYARLSKKCTVNYYQGSAGNYTVENHYIKTIFISLYGLIVNVFSIVTRVIVLLTKSIRIIARLFIHI